MKVVLVAFTVTQIIFIDFFEPLQRLWIISLSKIIMCYANTSLIFFSTCGIIRNKLFHQYISIGLIGSNGAIGDVKGTVGFHFFIGYSQLHFFEKLLSQSVLIFIIQQNRFVKIFRIGSING